jgi:hypothetical protein
MKVHSFTAVAGCVVLLSCSDKGRDSDGGACGAGYENASRFYSTLIASDPFKPYLGNPVDGIVYYNYLPGSPAKVQFFVGFNAKSICTVEHMKIDYSVKMMTSEPQTLSMKISGDAYWSAFNDEIILFNGIPNPGQEYNGSLNVGLKQAFSQGGGDVDAFVNVEFTSSGNFSLDSAYFVKHVRIMEVSSKYSKF